MDISALFDAARRRILALLAVLLLALGGAAVGWFSSSTVYDASTVAIVVPAPVDLDGRPVNPLDRVGFATTQLATMSTVVATSPAMATGVAQQTGATVLTASNTTQERTSAPQPGIQITVTTRAESPEAAAAGGEVAVRLMNEELARLQREIGVPGAQQAKIVMLLDPQATASSSRSALRAAGGLFVGIAGLGTATVLVADAWLRRRRERSHPTRGRGPEGTASVDTGNRRIGTRTRVPDGS